MSRKIKKKSATTQCFSYIVSFNNNFFYHIKILRKKNRPHHETKAHHKFAEQNRMELHAKARDAIDKYDLKKYIAWLQGVCIERSVWVLESLPTRLRVNCSNEYRYMVPSTNCSPLVGQKKKFWPLTHKLQQRRLKNVTFWWKSYVWSSFFNVLYFPPDLFAEAVEEVAVRGEADEETIYKSKDGVNTVVATKWGNLENQSCHQTPPTRRTPGKTNPCFALILLLILFKVYQKINHCGLEITRNECEVFQCHGLLCW